MTSFARLTAYSRTHEALTTGPKPQAWVTVANIAANPNATTGELHAALDFTLGAFAALEADQ